MKQLIKYLPLALLFLSCAKQEGGQREEIFDTHSTWTDDSTNNFWDKHSDGGFQIDTAWKGDTIIYF